MLFFRKKRMNRKRGEGAKVLPAGNHRMSRGKKAFSGALTVEAACVVPLFLFAMLAVMQFLKILLVSVSLLGAMHDTAKTMAAYAYIKELGVTAGDGVAADLLTGGLSGAYAKNRVEQRAGLQASDGTISLWKSSFTHNDIIDLAVTYKAKNTYTVLPIPAVKSALRARVRAWTGRDGDGSSEDGEGDSEEKGESVYVAETGHVYHKDASCTHIKLSIKSGSLQSVQNKRNKSGGKYHACERCGGGSGTVFYTTYGDRYHSSLGCSGLKRTVKSVQLSELEGWRACSKCGG